MERRGSSNRCTTGLEQQELSFPLFEEGYLYHADGNGQYPED